jgi:glycosyltransferase involved in cell wall biosynthesis
VTLGILYHMPFWQTADGALWEGEGSFARYVDSLAPYFDRVLLAAPVYDRAPAAGSRVRAPNVELAPLPYFPGPRQFYPLLPSILPRLGRWVDRSDVVHLRVPTPAAYFAERIARKQKKPVFLLVVGDYEALLPHLPYRGVKKALFGAYVAFEERALARMTMRHLTFANGAALRTKHEAHGAKVHETKTTTVREADIAARTDTCAGERIRLLSVSRIDPRKGLRVLPAALASLVASGRDVTLDIVGPALGQIGDDEVAAIRADAATRGVAERITFRGALPLDELMPLYREFDAFVLPTKPGEGIPRVLMEAMAAGTPVVTTNVAGISGLITSGENGLLSEDTPAAIAAAIESLIATPSLRQRIIQGGYDTARAHTLDRQAAAMMAIVKRELGAKRSKICFVLPSLAGGGAERAAVQILNGLDPALWHRSMYLFLRDGPYLKDVASDIAIHSGRGTSRAERWLDLRRYLAATRPDVVVSFLSYFTVLTAARAAGAGSRVVFNQQTPMTAFLSDEDYAWRHGWRRRLFTTVTRGGYAAADLVVGTSRGVVDDLEASFGVARKKMRVVHNPVDLDAVRAAAREPLDGAFAGRWQSPVLVAAGRLADAKNYPLMIDALALLRQRVPARLFVLGRGEREGMLRDLIRARGVEDAVVLCGFQTNPWKFIARADAFLLTSRYEGFGNVLIEAMACGVPVVATASPGTRDIVRHGLDGMLVEHHQPADVAAALETILTDADRRADMAADARRSAERFALNVIAREYDAVFQEALA